MPPSTKTDQAIVRWLTRLLCAQCLEAGGEIRIPNKFIRELEQTHERQVLVEDLDSAKDELVLRFGTKHSAVYPVESEGAQACLTPQQVSTIVQPRVKSSQGSRAPLTDAQLADAERKIKAARQQARARLDQQQIMEELDLTPSQ